jgi:hypothetical protein
MAFIVIAMAGGIATAEMTQAHRAGQQIGRDVETGEEFKLALTKAGRLRAFGQAVHAFSVNVLLAVQIQLEQYNSRTLLAMRK